MSQTICHKPLMHVGLTTSNKNPGRMSSQFIVVLTLVAVLNTNVIVIHCILLNLEVCGRIATVIIITQHMFDF